MADTANKRAKTSIETECRACLAKICDDSFCVDLFRVWDPPWSGMGESIAEDLAKLANIQISVSDPYSKSICKTCCYRLQDAVNFTWSVQNSDIKLRTKHQNCIDETPWPKPIQVDKNLTSDAFNEMHVEVKQEIVTEDEYEMSENCSEQCEPNLDIKIEPEEITPPIGIQINGSFSLPEEPTDLPKINGATEYLDEGLLHDVKAEPTSDDETESVPGMPMDCMLCMKTFNTVKGLKMPKSRPRSTNKAQWSSETLSKAEDLMRGGSSMRQTAKIMNIPFSSLQQRLKMKDTSEPRLGRLPVFSKEVEEDLANRVKSMAKTFYGYTATQIRKVAYQYAEDHGVKNNFDKSAKMAGRDWLEGFLKRNDISVRKPKATSMSRNTAFNKTEVQMFYDLLEQLYEKYNFRPQNIYNCDETEISTVQDPGKKLAPKGVKRVGSISSWERGKNITLLCAMNAAGGFVPPMFIFPRKRMCPQLEKDGPAGAMFKCSDNGWINENLFLEWLQHFTAHAKPSPEQPILLILGNHASHISLHNFEHCKKNNIHMLTLPPHTSHRMQPLHVLFFGPFKAAYKRECYLFLESGHEKITPYDVASLANKAYYEAVASINEGVSGFRATGIFPLNPRIFSNEDFLPAEILNSEIVVQDCSTSQNPSTSMAAPATTSSPVVVADILQTDTSASELMLEIVSSFG